MPISLTKSMGSISLTKELPSNKFILGAGWDSRFDLDLSLIPKFAGQFDASLIVYFGNLRTHYALHSGDNRTGIGMGDDETIVVDLNKLPGDVNILYASVYCYSKGNFGGVKGEYFKLYDDKKQLKIEVRLDMQKGIEKTTHLVPLRFVRNGNEWNVEYIARYDLLPNSDINSAVSLVQNL